MKQTKRPAGKATARPSKTAAKRVQSAVRAKRSWHQRLLLHPFSVMVLLCAGVLIVGASFRGYADSYNVTATVPAPTITQPAVISTPLNQVHTSASTVTVVGSCPDQSYVKLLRNAAFSGAAQCVSNTFQIQASLDSGANELNPQVYNLTDQAGPAATPVMVYYDPVVPPTPAPTPPATTPTNVAVATVDNATYKQGVVVRSSDNPTVDGWAPPFSQIVVTFHSNPTTCLTTADNSGWWTCTLDKPLPVGIHRVDISATTPDGQKLQFPTFQITVLASLQNVLVKDVALLDIRGDYRYSVAQGGKQCTFTVGLIGGTSPYQIVVDWGDGTHSTLTRTDQSIFNVVHKYDVRSASDKWYPVVIKATDANDNSALLQVGITLRGVGTAAAVNSMLGGVHHWLWVVWPVYGIVVLMAIGYYLGEREEYRRLMNSNRRASSGRPSRA
jgi:hypothetical protein